MPIHHAMRRHSIVSGDFISTWTVTAASKAITLPLMSTGTYDFVVDWGDLSSDTITVWNEAATTHTYASAGTYIVQITGVISGFRFNDLGSKTKLYEISNWGTLELISNAWFYGCTNLVIVAPDKPEVNTTSYANGFSRCTALDSVPGITMWNRVGVTTMLGLFRDCPNYNQNLNGFVGSSVTTVQAMFMNDTVFSGACEDWNTSNVTTMEATFYATAQDGTGVAGWSFASVTNASGMYRFGQLTKANYDYLLGSMAASATVFAVSFHAGSTPYSNIGAHDFLTGFDPGPPPELQWIIQDGGYQP